MTAYDPKKVALEAIEATSGVLTSIRRQSQRIEHDMEKLAQAHDDLKKIEGWVRGELAQQITHKRKLEEAGA